MIAFRRRSIVLVRTALAFSAAALVSAQMLGGAPLASAGALDLDDPNLLVVGSEADRLWEELLPPMVAAVRAYPVAGPYGPESRVPGDAGPLAASVEAHRRADGTLNPADRPSQIGLTSNQLTLVRLVESVPNGALAVGQNEGVAAEGALPTRADSYDLLAWLADLERVRASNGLESLVQADGYALGIEDLDRAIAQARATIAANKWTYNQRWLARWELLRGAGRVEVAEAERRAGFLVRVDSEPGVGTPAASDCEAFWSQSELPGVSVPILPAGMTCTPLPSTRQPLVGTFGSGDFCTGPSSYQACASSPEPEDYAGSRTLLSEAPSAPAPADEAAGETAGAGGALDSAALSAELAVATDELATAQRSLPRLQARRDAAAADPDLSAAFDRLIVRSRDRIAELQIRVADLREQLAELE